jgi:hypothetical protein
MWGLQALASVPQQIARAAASLSAHAIEPETAACHPDQSESQQHATIHAGG